MKLSIKITLLALLLTQVVSAQYLHRQGKYIVDGNGNEFIIRSMGLGGWMLQEGYMMESSGFAGTQHQLKAKIEQLVGKEGMEQFYDAWLTNYCQKEDVDSMAAWGFNAIRLPMHYNLFTLPIDEEPVPGADTWLPKGFEMVDNLLDWCEANHMYLILDLHAAPGGQGKDAAISDYDSSKPSLWESAENRRKTVALWKKLAERYANEQWIGGYDLLNETNWTFSGTNLLRSLYNDLTTAIRSVDTNHILFIEGNWFANDFTGLTPAWEDNMVYSFHKYWSYNDLGSIQGYLNMRNSQNRPLWLGEAGENSNPWFTSAIDLMEKNKIGWAWWPYKKIGSVTGTVTIPKTTGYQALLNYWNNGGTKPSVETAKAYLMEQAEQLKLNKCIIHRDVLDAMFRQAQGDKSPKPFVKHTIPGKIYAVNYDLGGNNRAYFDVDSADFHVSTDVYTAWNSGYAYRNDAVDIEACKDALDNNGYSIGWTNDKEWMLYTVDIDSSALYQFDLRYAASGSAGRFHLTLDGVDITPVTAVPSSGGWATWKTLTLNNVILQKGRHKIKLYVDKAGFNINYLTFSNPQELVNIQPVILNAKTDAAWSLIYLTSNVSYDITSLPLPSNFTVTVNSVNVEVNSVHFDDKSNYGLILSLNQRLKSTDNITISYNGELLRSADNIPFAAFENVKVFNNSPLYVNIPAKIEAEKFYFNQGLSLEDCTDTGLGKNIAYTNAGDYLDYLINVPSNGTFSFDYRLASTSGGTIELLLMDDPTLPLLLHTVTVPNTGGWQTWKTVTVTAALTKGPHMIRLYIKKPEFNVNWFQITLVTGLTTLNESQQLNVFPNPANGQLFFNSTGLDGNYTVKIINLQGMVVKQYSVKITQGNVQQVDISSLAEGSYLFTIENKSDKYYSRFIKTN